MQSARILTKPVKTGSRGRRIESPSRELLFVQAGGAAARAGGWEPLMNYVRAAFFSDKVLYLYHIVLGGVSETVCRNSWRGRWIGQS